MHRFLVSIFSLGFAALGAHSLQAAPLSLLDHRFQVEAEWRTADGQTGFGTPVRLTPETGYFWFFSPTNTEVVVKVLDGCAVNGRFWVFAGGLTDTEVTLTVTDEANGTKKVYRNPPGTPFEPIQDTGAFSTCDAAHCGRGSFSDLAASPRANRELEALASAMAGTLVAPQAVYDRVVADVAAIDAQGNPDVRGVTFYRNFELHTLELEVDFATGTEMSSGRYDAWDCLNRRYGMLEDRMSVALLSPRPGVVLEFDKVLDTRKLVEDYTALPGVIGATPLYGAVFLIPGQSVSSYCGRIEGDLYKYFIRRTNGTIYHYTSRPGSAPVAGGTSQEIPDPAWLAEAQACFREHVDPIR